MTLTEIIGKKTLQYICDGEKIIKELDSLKETFEDNTYVRYYATEGYLTKDEFDKNIDELISVVEKLSTEEFAIKAMNEALKKKNGTFNKTRIYDCYDCDNCIYFTEWNNSWSFHRLKIKAQNDTTLYVYLEKTTSTP